MKKMMICFLFVALATFLASCGHTEVDQQLQGSWVLKSNSFDAVHTFSFMNGDVRINSANSLTISGKGTYSISNDKIYMKWTEVTGQSGTVKNPNGISTVTFDYLSYSFENEALSLYWGSFPLNRR